jgi:uncharacterized BrkB/YihY/UPF0761 family membrane protein
VTVGAERLARLRDAAAHARERLPWNDVVTAALERERFSAAGLLAGGLAYRLFFWLVPLGLTLAAILSFWVENDRAGLEDAAREFGLGGAAASAAADAIAESARSRWYFLVAGIWLLGWFGAGVVRALNVAHAVAWRLPPEKVRQPYLRGAVFTGLTISMILLSSGAAVVREYDPGTGLAVTLSLVVAYLGAFVWGSSHLPHRAAHWTAFVPGATLVAVGTQLVHLLAVYYLAPRLGRSSELYGALGSATVILLWLYLVARLIVAAAFANAALWEHRQGFTPSG